MKFEKVIVIFTFGFFIGSLSSYAIAEKKWESLRADMERLEQEISSAKEKIEPLKKFVAKVTGYSNDNESINVPEWRDGMTATGTIASKGTIAADWDVFKPGTKLYVPDYGIGTIEDRGSKVKGYHFDLFFDSREKALEWGVRQMEVMVVENEAENND